MYLWKINNQPNKKKGEKSCDEDEELAAPEGAREEGWLCGGIAGCAGVCAEE
jgi:hypothetical protein